MAKQASLKRLSQSFLAQLNPSTKEKHHLRVIALFCGKKIEDFSIQLQKIELPISLKKYIEIGAFNAKEGEMLFFPEEKLFIGGMGEFKNWHPEKACSLFRKFGNKLAKLKNISVEFIFTAELKRALLEHQKKKSTFTSQLKLDINSKSQKRSKSTKFVKKESKKENDDIPIDYIANFNISDLISQLIICMNIGAENMAFLKKDYIKQKKSIPVCITITNEKQDNIKRALKNGDVLSDLLHGTRYLAELPGNYLNPNSYEVYARSLAKEFALDINVFDDFALKKIGCGGILAVGQGSNISPRMIVLEYKPKKNKGVRPLILVGKGITFDTGGISLKPSSEMHEMKYDMCGSSLALHAIALAAAKQLSLPIISILGLAENMPGGKSVKPGDVYTAYDGTTVENQNTDAEGRLVLGDLLAYGAINYDPLCILDFATLTGACLVALGHHATAVMTSSEDLFSRIEDASFQSLDRIWRMPHWSVYGEGLKSNIADQRNIAGRGGGTISAMRFLSRFVPKEIPWAHFDIAGTAWQSKEFASQGKGATGWGLRLLSSFMQNLVK